MKELTYELKMEFDYAYRGDQRTAKFITLTAPTVENIGYIAKLKQGFMQAVAAQSKEVVDIDSTKEGSVDDLSGEMVMAMLSMSDIDYAQYLQTAKAAFSESGAAKVDGEEPLKKALINKMSVDDL